MSDFCVVANRLSASIEDPGNSEFPEFDEDFESGNQFDTDATVEEILVHNETYDRVCGGAE